MRHAYGRSAQHAMALFFCTLIVSVSATFTPAASAAVPTRLPIRAIKLIDYFPAENSWTNMWSNFTPNTVNADFARIHELGANTVRLTLDPYELGWPTVSTTMSRRLAEVIDLAQANQLHVQLTLFDWFAAYNDISPSEEWLTSLLEPYRNDPEIAFIDLQNEIDTSNAQAMRWARNIMASAKSIVGSVPLTFSVSSPFDLRGILALKEALGTEGPDLYDFHYYGLPGDAASVFSSIQAAVAPTPLFIGETGMSTYSAQPAQEALLQSQQANYYAAVETATASLGLPAAAPWMLNDLVSTGVPATVNLKPQQLNYGLFTATGQPKPAAAVVQDFFKAGFVPPILDPSFEQGSHGVPDGWSTSGNGTMTWPAEPARSGRYSVEISGSGSKAEWKQVINVGVLARSEKLQATVWAKGSAVTGNNVLTVAWFGSTGKYLSNNMSPPLPKGASNWTELAVEASAPPGAAYAVLALLSSNNSGEVWFDDVDVSQ